MRPIDVDGQRWCIRWFRGLVSSPYVLGRWWDPVQRRVLLEDGALEVAQFDAGVEPELLVQGLAGVFVGAQRVRLAARAVQGEHQLLVEALSQRQALDELGQVPDRVAVASETQQQLDPAFRRGPPQLVESGDLATGEVHAGDVLERVASPQPERSIDLIERGAQLLTRSQRVRRREVLDGRLEAVCIDPGSVDEQRVAAGPRLQQRSTVWLR